MEVMSALHEEAGPMQSPHSDRTFESHQALAETKLEAHFMITSIVLNAL